jgi:hypothetical protein
MALPFTLKSLLRQKRRIMENSNISPMQKYNLQKNSSQRNPKNPSTYHNSITDLKFQHKSKYRLSKILI